MSHIPVLVLAVTFPPDIGGIGNITWGICKNAEMFQPTVLTTKTLPHALEEESLEFAQHNNGTISGANQSPVFQVFRFLTAQRSQWDKIRFAIRALQIARRVRPKIIYCQTVYDGVIGFILSKLLGIPYVVHIYSEELHAQSPITYGVHTHVLRRANKVIALGSYGRTMLLRRGVAENRIAVLNPGVGLPDEPLSDELRQAIAERHGLQGKQVLLSVSRLVRDKGIDTVIKALPDIVAEVPNAHYLVVGAGPFEKDLRKLAEERLMTDNVTFVGHVDNYTGDGPLGYYYDACDVFLMLSRPGPDGQQEGFGMTLVEAGGYGKPVIGGNSGGINDAVIPGKTGFIVDPSNNDDVVSSILRLLKDKDLALQLGRNGKIRVQEELTWKIVGGKFEQVLCECLN